MATTSDNMDYSLSNDEKLILHNKHSENKSIEENTAGPSTEINIASSVDSAADNRDQPRRSADLGTTEENKIVSEAIAKVETILHNLKKQRDTSAEDIRIIRDVSKKKSRKSRKRYASSPRSDSFSDSCRTRPERSPSPKRTKKEIPQKKYYSDSSINKEERSRDSSLSSLNSYRSYSGVTKELRKELSGKLKKDRSKSPRRNKSNTRYSRRDSYTRKDRSSRSGRDDSYDKYSKKKSRRNSGKYNNYGKNYHQMKSNYVEERYLRCYSVMNAFSIIMDILRQDIYSTY